MTALTRRWKPIAAAALAALTLGVLGGSVTDVGPWYQKLAKPSWQPPDWLFGPAWTIIFALAAIAGVKAWHGARGDPAGRRSIVALFALNGGLNFLWSLLFFGLKRPDWALYEVGLLWLSIVALIVGLRRYSPTASLLLVPYLLWVSFASYLNWEIVRLNGLL